MKHACLLLIAFLLAGISPQQACAEGKTAKQQAPVMLTREFKTPPDFLISTVDDKNKQNPFERKTAKEVLEAWGVLFPEGAAASFNPANSRLVVRNTEENLEVVSELVDEEMKKAPRTMVIQATVIEGPGKLIRELNAAAATKMSAAKELGSLLEQAKEKESKVSVVGDAWLEARSGRRASTETVREHIFASRVSLDAKSHASLELEMRQIGLRLELEPTIGTDNREINLTTALNLFPALPQTRPVSVTDPMSGSPVEFPVSDVCSVSFVTGISLLSGDTRIFGIAKPVGKAGAGSEDVLWMAFITAHVVPVQILQTAHAPETAEPSKQPPPDKNAKPAKHLSDLLPPGCGVGEYPFDTKPPLTTFSTLHTVQAAAPLLRALAAKAASASNHDAIWKEIEAAAARGEVTFIDSHVLESQSGVNAEINATRECVYPASFETNALGQADLTFEMRPMGSRLTLAPTISHDEHTVSMDIDYELQTAPPNRRREVFRDPGSKQNFEMPIMDFHTAHLRTGFTLSSGSTRLLTLWKPTGHDDADILWATFLHAEVMRQIAPPRPQPAAPSVNVPPPDENEWITRVFTVPPDFANGKQSATQLLEAAGISFPKGAKAYFHPTASKLIVRNQRKHMDLVEAYVEPCGLGSFPQSLVFTTHIIQAPGPLIRRVMTEASGHCDHRAQLDQLLASAEVKHLGTSHIETHSGVRATSTEAVEHRALCSIDNDGKGHLGIEHETRNVGLLMSVEPSMQTDGSTVAITLDPEFHTAEPQEHREVVIDTQGRKVEFPLTDYHAAKIVTSMMMPEGTARLLGVWKPTGKPEVESADILQAVFITCDLLR